MNRPIPLLIATLVFVSVGWSIMVARPQSVVGKLTAEEGYPTGLFGKAQQGEAIYVRSGCVECHTQQVRGVAADLREYGPRRSVANDYLGLERPLLGWERLGPDLSNVGARYAGRRAELYQILLSPDEYFDGSFMPAHRFLFDTVSEDDAAKSADLALGRVLGETIGLEKGVVVLPTSNADRLVDYLMSLKRDNPLDIAPVFTETESETGE